MTTTEEFRRSDVPTTAQWVGSFQRVKAGRPWLSAQESRLLLAIAGRSLSRRGWAMPLVAQVRAHVGEQAPLWPFGDGRSHSWRQAHATGLADGFHAVGGTYNATSIQTRVNTAGAPPSRSFEKPGDGRCPALLVVIGVGKELFPEGDFRNWKGDCSLGGERLPMSWRRRWRAVPEGGLLPNGNTERS